MTRIHELLATGQELAALAGSDLGQRHPELAVRALTLALWCGLAALDLFVAYCTEALHG